MTEVTENACMHEIPTGSYQIDNWMPKCGDQKSSLGWRTTVGKTYLETKEKKVTGQVREKFGLGGIVGVREEMFQEGYDGNCIECCQRGELNEEGNVSIMFEDVVLSY